MPCAVSFRSVSKSYAIYEKPAHRLAELLSFNRIRRRREHWALRDVSFEVRAGDVFCLVGENGSGKSTTLQLAARIFGATSGEVEIHGRVSALLELGAGFNPEFSGRDNVFLSGAVLGLSSREMRSRYGAIEAFAEIGDFINRPVKTYSSGMLVRLAFAVAINVEPDILLVDEALAVGDYYFRQRCMRKVHELRRKGVTILFVSHAMSDVKELGTQCLWLEEGRMVELGKPDDVVRKYLGRMARKDADYVEAGDRGSTESEAAATIAPEVVETIPNIDHRHGDGAAEIIGIAALAADGRALREMEPGRPMVLRISVRANRPLAAPNIGFMMRNHLGVDFAGTNTSREAAEMAPMQPGEIATVDFHLQIPELYAGHFSFSPAVADGDHVAYRMADWIDNALTLEMGHAGKPVYGYIHLPCEVRVNARLADAAPLER